MFDWLRDGERRSLFDSALGEAIPMDVSRKDDSLIVRASMPGFEAKEIDLQVAGDTLSIRAEHKGATEKEEERYYRRERSIGFCSRSIQLPEPVAADKVTAEFRHGVLTITAPVANEAKSSRVEIQAA